VLKAGPEVQADPSVFILDLFGVMISFDNNIVYERLAQHCADPAVAVAKLDGLMAGHDVITGAVTLPEIHQRLVLEHGLRLDLRDFTAAWLEPYSASMPEMADLVEDLAQAHRLVLLSNVDRYYWKIVLEMEPQLRRFDELLLSCDLGLAKPDPAIFRHACAVAGAPPSRCYFVDDSAVNVESARAVGLQAHLFRDTATLRDALRAIGVGGV
jgi:HAD superfamily hydrolase (TIGR01509 family)